MYKEAQKHFKKADPVLHEASLQFEISNMMPSADLFRDIVWTIIGQQLSGKAADTIFERFRKLCRGKVTPQKVLALSDASIRGAGLSGAKMNAVRAVSRAIQNKELNLKTLNTLSDEGVIEELTKTKGIGPWTAEMILMFSLGRADIFSYGDLGLQKGLMHLYGLKKLPEEKKLLRFVQMWSPYRSYAARVLWKVADAQKGKSNGRKMTKVAG